MLDDLTKIVQNENVDNMPKAICSYLSMETFSVVVLVDSNMRQIIYEDYKNIDVSAERIFTAIDFKRECFEPNRCVIPLKYQGDYMASLVLYKEEIFSKSHGELIKSAALVLSIAMLHMRGQKSTFVKSAISTLSYSELEAVLTIFEEFNGHEILIVASKVADKKKISRSVIVNALRKLESAGVIESRSLGMKGTYIKVTNIYLLDELKKFKG